MSTAVDDRPDSAAPSSSLSTQELIQKAIQEGTTGVRLGEGGPFGAVIVQNGRVIASAHNMVLQSNDPTAHAEVVAIRLAAAALNRFSLHDCELYASCYPCPMCLSASVWAKIPKVYYASSPDDAARVGFDDRVLYDFIRGHDAPMKCTLVHVPDSSSDDPFNFYAQQLAQSKINPY